MVQRIDDHTEGRSLNQKPNRDKEETIQKHKPQPCLQTHQHMIPDLSRRAFCRVRQPTKVPPINMWHIMTRRHRSMKFSAADGSKVPLREIRQRRCR